MKTPCTFGNPNEVHIFFEHYIHLGSLSIGRCSNIKSPFLILKLSADLDTQCIFSGICNFVE